MKLRKATLTDYGVPPDDIPTLQSHFDISSGTFTADSE